MITVKDVGFCDFCKKISFSNYFIYIIEFRTNTNTYTIGILSIYEELGDFLMKKGIHLSASQVILLRPDITIEFLKYKYNTPTETVLQYFLTDAEICQNCFQEYKNEIPEK
jgi:hypothetical protein